jgi:tetratricopeptide (TPR) repeat protein
MRGMSSVVFIVAVVAITSVVGGCSRTSPQGRHDRFMAAGRKRLDKRDYARAALEFKNAARIMPQDAEAQYELGLAALGLQDLRGAMVLFQKTRELDPKHVGAQLKLAELLSSTNDPELLEDAEKRVKSVLLLAPGNTDALNIMAVDELKLGHPDSAEALLSKSLETAPAQIQVYAKLAGLALKRNDPAAAERVLKLGIAAAPTSSEPHSLLAHYYLVTHRAAEAEVQFQRAAEMSPQSGATLVDLGQVQNDSGKADAAEKTFQKASGLSDKRYKAVHAIFLWEQGKKDAAIRELAGLVKTDPTNRSARTQLVAAYLASGRAPEAMVFLTSALKNNHRDVEALVQRSEIYLERSNPKAALADLTAVVSLRADDARVHYLLSRVYEVQSQDSLRRQELSEALRRDPSLLAVRVELADTFIRAPELALTVLNAAPKEQAHLLPMIVMRNWALIELGDVDSARRGIAEGFAQSNLPELMLQDAVLKLRLHQTKNGRLVLEEILGENPDNVRALRALANSYFSGKEPAPGIAKVREYADRQRNSAPMQGYLGEVLLVAGDRVGARAAFLASKTADGSFQPADVGLALLDAKDGNLDSARRTLRRLTEGPTPNSLAAVRLGMIEESAHNYPAAIAAFTKAVELKTGDWVSLNDLAYCLIITGQPDEALKYAQQAKEIVPGNPFVTDTLGWAFYNKGVYEAAIAQLETLKNDPSAAHRYHLAMAYFKRGDITRGQATLEVARRMAADSPEASLAQQVAIEATRIAQEHR